MNYPIICLCGSTKFKETFEKMEKEFALKGNVVLTVSCFPSSDPDPRLKRKKEMLDNIHLQKIRMSDKIFVINLGGYIGESTSREIQYAKKLGKVIRYLESDDDL